MNRALSVSCVAIFLVAMGSVAQAKPTIAVLGLEVADQSGTPTAGDTQVAKELTEGLRARAKAGTSAYQIAVQSEKELIDQKLMNNCDNEAVACMAVIGNQLGADFLMYGNIKKIDKDKTYQVQLKLLDVGHKTKKQIEENIPVADATGPAVQAWAKKLYAKLAAEGGGSSLVVKLTNADRGTILINGDERGNITNGSGTVSGLEPKTYHVTVESEGFRRYEKDVTIGGKTETVNVELEKGGEIIGSGPGAGGSSGEVHKSKSGGSGWGWKAAFYGSVGVTAIGGVVLFMGWRDVNSEIDKQCLFGVEVRDGCFDDAKTANHEIWYKGQNDSDYSASLQKGNDAVTRERLGGIILGGGAVLSMFTLYKAYFAKGGSSSSEHASRGHRQRKQRTFVVTPVAGANGGGATLRFDW